MAAKKGKEIRERHASDRIFNAAVIILSITTFIVIAYPLWFIVIASISNSNMVNQRKVILWPVDIRFYGYQQIWEDSRIWTGYLNTLIYVVVGTVLNLVVTLPAAYALSRPVFKARNAVMMYFVFTMYFSGGLVPLYMTIKSIGFIGNRWIMILMVLVNTYNLIIARTFIQNTIPNDLYEAAQIDGASSIQQFRYITVPQVSPTTFFLAIMGIIGSFKVFDMISVLTAGGPGNSTSVMAYYIYKTAFTDFKMGYACALAWVLFLLIFAVTLVQWKFQDRFANE